MHVYELSQSISIHLLQLIIISLAFTFVLSKKEQFSIYEWKQQLSLVYIIREKNNYKFIACHVKLPQTLCTWCK